MRHSNGSARSIGRSIASTERTSVGWTSTTAEPTRATGGLPQTGTGPRKRSSDGLTPTIVRSIGSIVRTRVGSTTTTAKRTTTTRTWSTSSNRQLRAATSGPRYTIPEQALADRVQLALAKQSDREFDAFVSYARIDGADVGSALTQELQTLGATVWFDEVAIVPGKSQARQMDIGLQRARAGVAVLTPAYLAGRFWTERELGALLHKETLIPVLHGVTFDQVKEYSGILPDLAGFETSRDSIGVIAQKIAAAILVTVEEAA